MTNNLSLLRENRRVESVDPALKAAFAWQAEAPDDRDCSAALIGFVAGAQYERAKLAQEIAPEIVGMLDGFVMVLRVFDRPDADQYIAGIQAKRDALLELCAGVRRER